MAIILLLPIFIFIFLFIKIVDGGPAFYFSKRVGLNGKVFSLPKFRTMKIGTHNNYSRVIFKNKVLTDEEVILKCRNDPRVTKYGKVLRKFSLDELPQLFTVLVGEMSIVGPRPSLIEEVILYQKIGFERTDVKPGLTCIWQTSGRSDLPYNMQIRMDLQYIKKKNLLFDCYLILKTIPIIIMGRGAY